MGEAPQEESKAAEAQDEAQEEEKGDGEKEPPSPAILSVDINCPGCAKKVKRTILKSRGVEDVQVDLAGKQVTVKGMIDPQALCTKVERKTKKKASVISPISPAAKDEPEIVNAQASGEMNTVTLNVNMHCEPCALQLRKRILRMRGVQTAETDFATGKVTVTGTMDANELVEYVYKRTRKQANVIAPPPSPPPPAKEAEVKPAEESEPEEKKEEDKLEEGKAEEKIEEGKVEEKTEEGKEEEKKEEGGGEEEKKGEEDGTKKEEEEAKDNQEEKGGGGEEEGNKVDEDDTAKKMVYYPPIYVIERVYAPQLFSDENPNACCIL
ncbi:hypothetical protein EJ110_NYTH29035 [Nymphaea thermarum]|nr:hypothetical protein EJ110_NYTH29035 [Nymphaea thermarum]